MAVIKLEGRDAFKAIIDRHASRVRVPRGGYIAGGCFKDWLAGKRPKGVDVFFRSAEDFDRALLDMSMERKMVYQGERAVAFEPARYGDPHIELIRYGFGEPQEVLETFDFTVCQMSWEDGEVFCSPTFFEDLTARRLHVDAMPAPVGTYLRMLRYCGYGFRPDAETAKRVAEALIALPEGTEVDIFQSDGYMV